MKISKFISRFSLLILILTLNVTAQPIITSADINQATELDQDVKLIFRVDAHNFSNGKLNLPVDSPEVRPQPIFEDINIWQYPDNVRKAYRETLGLTSLKEKTNYDGTCEQFISDRSTLVYYQGKVEGIVRHNLKRKPQQEILVRLICLHGENIQNKYRINGGNQNIMVYDVKNNSWLDRPITRPLTKQEINLLENIDFAKNFDVIGRHVIPVR